MSDLNQTYLARAAEARASASQPVLANVRQKHLASAAAWERLAHTAGKMAELRDRRLAARTLAPNDGAARTAAASLGSVMIG